MSRAVPKPKYISKVLSSVYPKEYEAQQARFKRYRTKQTTIDRHNTRQKLRRKGQGPRKYYEQKRSWNMRTKYGIDIVEFNSILEKQNGVCAICRNDKKNSRDWHIDHEHGSNPIKIRGILCHHCNLMLGNARDNPDVLRAAIGYLS